MKYKPDCIKTIKINKNFKDLILLLNPYSYLHSPLIMKLYVALKTVSRILPTECYSKYNDILKTATTQVRM